MSDRIDPDSDEWEGRRTVGRRWITVISGAGLAFSACATSPSGSLREGDVQIGKLTVPDSVKAGAYVVTFERVEKADPSIVLSQGCFFWNSEGPFCSPADASAGGGTVSVRLVTRNPNTYRLTGYLTYSWKGEIRKSNQVAATLRVVP
jgi:hypothetical protein